MPSRRRFLQAAVAVPAAARLAPAAPGAEPRLSVMLWTLKGSFEQRMEAAAQAGIRSAQLVTEWTPWSEAEGARLLRLGRSLGLGFDALLAQENWRERPVTLVNPAHREGFLADLRRAAAAAKRLECPRLIVMSGNDQGTPHAAQYASLVEGLKRGGELAAREGLTLILEPLNSLVNHKGYFLTSGVEGLRAIREVNHPNVRLLFDLYHQQVQEGNVIDTFRSSTEHIAVFHVADCPGRHDPGTGELNYANIYRAIARTGFQGHIAMEYLPEGEQVASLSRAVRELRQAMA